MTDSMLLLVLVKWIPALNKHAQDMHESEFTKATFCSLTAC